MFNCTVQFSYIKQNCTVLLNYKYNACLLNTFQSEKLISLVKLSTKHERKLDIQLDSFCVCGYIKPSMDIHIGFFEIRICVPIFELQNILMLNDLKYLFSI